MCFLSRRDSSWRWMDLQGLTGLMSKGMDTMPDHAKRILIVAGEASADRYGAALVMQLKSMRYGLIY